MLDILLPTIGSAGDVHPVIAVGRALRARGHRATVITNEFFEKQVRDSGLDFVAMGTIREAEQTMADPRLWHPTQGFGCIVERAIIPNISRLYDIIRDHRTSSTVIAASALCFGARIAQEKFGIPLASVHLQPAILRSLEDGGRQGRIPMDRRIPRFLKRALFWAVDNFWIDRMLAPPINAFRATVGLPAVSGIFRDYLHSPDLVIGMFPEWFGPAQPDWPKNLQLAGFVLHDRSDQQAIDGEAETFLRAGPPPLVFTPGSAASTLKDFFRQSVDACRIGGFRGMLVTNYAEQVPRDLPDGVRHFPYLPFSQILPRCAALIYPGGIGTMAQAIQAGIPHLVVPHGHDQPDNAYRIQRLGLGESVYPERYKANRVSELLGKLLASADVRNRCANYAKLIDSDAALGRACDLIEGLAHVTAAAAR